MAKIDLYSPEWVEEVFQGRNKEYGAYKLRMGTTKRNIWAIIIMLVTAAILATAIGVNTILENKRKRELELKAALELSKIEQEMKKEERKVEKKEQPKIEPQKVIPETRATQQFTPPVIKKDELVKEEKQLKQQDKLDEKIAVGAENKEGTTDRTVEAAKTDVVAIKDVAPPPPPPPAEKPKEEVKQVVENKVFDVVEQMPSFPGGQAAMMGWLSKNIRYPAAAQENNIQGRVTVQFVVDENGKVTNPVVVRGVDPSLDAEAIRVVSSMPKWTPGKQNGQAVKVKYTLPVQFKLQN